MPLVRDADLPNDEGVAVSDPTPFPVSVSKFVESSQWTFAKTMSVWPHEYLVRDRVDENDFEDLVRHISAHGFEGRFYQMAITYFAEDGLLYWTMGAPLERTTIINRCKEKDSYESRLQNGTLPPTSPKHDQPISQKTDSPKRFPTSLVRSINLQKPLNTRLLQIRLLNLLNVLRVRTGNENFSFATGRVKQTDMSRPRLSDRRTVLPKRQLHTRPPLDRMQQIFQSIKSGEFPNRHRLAADIEVTTKTIQRDLDFMRDRLKLPIAFDNEGGGYRFTQPISSFPMVELTEAELVSVFIGQKALTQYKGTPFEAPLRSAFDKLTSNLSGRLTMEWSDLDALVSFKSFEISPVDLTTFQTASEAVRKSQELQFEYKKLEAKKYQKRSLQPYHLACVQDQWYVIGHCLKRKALRTFVLARMKNATLSESVFERPQKFSIEKHLKHSFGVFTAKGSHTVRLKFDAFAGQLVRERVWHPSQKIQETSDGGLELTLQLSSLHEIEPWVLSWGEHVRVLGPAEFKKRISARFKASLGQM
jgi:predicted DNA-binding transcriptional regulator YafY